MKWIWNTQEGNLHKSISHFCRHKPGLRVVRGEPQATATFTTEELKRMGLVGLYEVEPEPRIQS